jgi:hypothetical protein
MKSTLKRSCLAACLSLTACAPQTKASDLGCAAALYRTFAMSLKNGEEQSIVSELREATFFYLGRLSVADRKKNWLQEVRTLASAPRPPAESAAAVQRQDQCIRAMSQLMGDAPRPQVRL